jgi:nitrogen-specific signal transduction histidine kinase
MNSSIIICHDGAHAGWGKQAPTPSVSLLVHEIRNPLCNIYLAYDALQLADIGDERQTCLDIIMKGAVRINKLIDAILASPEIQGTKSEPRSLSALLEEVLTTVEAGIMLKRIEISKDYADSEGTVSMDALKMKTALTNIIAQTVDALPSERGELTLSTRTAAGTGVIAIRDNGRGSGKIDLDKLFEPRFVQKAE